jgi:hypothetical protein
VFLQAACWAQLAHIVPLHLLMVALQHGCKHGCRLPCAPALQITAVVKAFGYPLDTALAVGLNLSQIGEFVFVLLSVANQQSLLPESVYMLLMGECCCLLPTCAAPQLVLPAATAACPELVAFHPCCGTCSTAFVARCWICHTNLECKEMLSVARLFPAASSAGVTALTLLLTPLTLQIANKFIPRARGNSKDGSPASDLELAGLNANGGAQVRACQLTRVGVRGWSVAGWVGWSQRLAFAGPFDQ